MDVLEWGISETDIKVSTPLLHAESYNFPIRLSPSLYTIQVSLHFTS
jgi:hypothetical protein